VVSGEALFAGQVHRHWRVRYHGGHAIIGAVRSTSLAIVARKQLHRCSSSDITHRKRRSLRFRLSSVTRLS
jgi:hypothetical protein